MGGNEESSGPYTSVYVFSVEEIFFDKLEIVQMRVTREIRYLEKRTYHQILAISAITCGRRNILFCIVKKNKNRTIEL